MNKHVNRFFITILVFSLISFGFPASAFAAIDDADDIRYSMDSDETLDFDEKDFNDVCEELTEEELDYVKFELPDKDEGVLYYNYDEDEDVEDQTKVSSSKKYYYSESSYISKIAFVPDEDYSGTLTINYAGYDVDDNVYDGKVKIAVDGGTSTSTITYTINYDDDYIQFDDEDFYDACEEIQKEELDYVKFTLPDSDEGILYYNYDEDSDDNTKVTSSKKYYYDSTPRLSRVYFVPDEDFSGSLTMKYTGYDIEGDSYSGKIKISVKGYDDDDSAESTITYSIDSNKDLVDFDEDDFNDVCEDLNDEELDYVTFTVPSASKGNLYYKYDDGKYSSVVTSSKKYYYDSSPYISDITFMPNKNFAGICNIEFSGRDVEGDSFSGTVVINIGGSNINADTITYTGKPNTALYMKDADFNNACKKLNGNPLDFVTFTLPSDSSGILYYGYNADGNYTSKVKAAAKYYYSGAPYILNVAYVPENNVSGIVTISYTGYDTNGLAYSGKIQINITNTGTAPTTPVGTLVSSKYFRDVDTSYSWAVPYIDNLYEKSIISGTGSSGTAKLYDPASNVKRGDFMLILYRALNLKTSSSTAGFSDVPSNSYYYTAIQTAKALGIAQGAYNKFEPNSNITREDAMVLALRAVNITSTTIPPGNIGDLNSYADYTSISDYSRSALASLVKAGVITGSDDNKLYPKGNLTRAQTAAIIYRIKDL
ncbi:MAG: S-layer homology domain-containing protein [Eubacteriales bacterium]|nr:S-layer homology domain-containing protein [Eubacteriales bacterium]